jgi:hypothetical protein
VTARLAWLGALVVGFGTPAALAPDSALACATCTSSAFGDLSFTWPHLALLLLPLVVTGGIGGVIVYCYRRGRGGPPAGSRTERGSISE